MNGFRSSRALSFEFAESVEEERKRDRERERDGKLIGRARAREGKGARAPESRSPKHTASKHDNSTSPGERAMPTWCPLTFPHH